MNNELGMSCFLNYEDWRRHNKPQYDAHVKDYYRELAYTLEHWHD